MTQLSSLTLAFYSEICKTQQVLRRSLAGKATIAALCHCMNRNLMAVLLFALLASSVYAASSQAVVVHSFVCNGAKFGICPDGSNPNFLLQGSDGNFYGTAAYSGTKQNGQPVFGGTVFSLTPTGKFTLLHTFTPGTQNNFPNGASPVSLAEGRDGNLYGLTEAGGIGFGDPTANNGQGYGVVFRISKPGSGFHVIHQFCSAPPNCTDGSNLDGIVVPLLVSTDGNVYGVSSGGGSGSGCGFGGGLACGTIFRISPSTGTYEVVFSFSYPTDGGFPYDMIMAADGSFYGLDSGGGLASSVFRYIPTTGALQLMTWSFPFRGHAGCPGAPACVPDSGLAFGPSGDLQGQYRPYDTGAVAGLYEGQPDGNNFQAFPPFTTTLGGGGQLVLASDRNFWFPRTTGSSKFGDIVALSPSKGTAVHTLTPFSKLVFAPTMIIQVNNGMLLGVSSGGIVTGSGHFLGGAVFTLDAGLPPR